VIKKGQYLLIRETLLPAVALLNNERIFQMAQQRSVGPLFSLAGGATVSWSISFGVGLDAGIVTAPPNIVDDVLGVVQLQAQNQGLGATSDSRNFYTVDIHNPGTQPVAHNLNLQNWL